MESKGLLASLFDLSFSEFITTRLVKVLFILGLIGAGLWTLALVVSGFRGGFLAGLGTLVLSPIVFLFLAMASRVWCELVIVIFRIAENTSRIAGQGSLSPTDETKR